MTIKEVDVDDTNLFDVRQLFDLGDLSTVEQNNDFDNSQNWIDNDGIFIDDNAVNLDNVLNVSYILGDIASDDRMNEVILDDQKNLRKMKEKFNILKKSDETISDNELSNPVRRNLSNSIPAISKSVEPRPAKLIRDGKAINVKGGLDFGNAVFDEKMGKRCIVKQEEIETIERSPILECKHR